MRRGHAPLLRLQHFSGYVVNGRVPLRAQTSAGVRPSFSGPRNAGCLAAPRRAYLGTGFRMFDSAIPPSGNVSYKYVRTGALGDEHTSASTFLAALLLMARS